MFFKLVHYYVYHIFHSIKILFHWLILAAVTGVVVGGFGALFAHCMNWVTDFRTEHDYIIFFLPLAGVLIVFLYSVLKYSNDKGTNLVLSMIHAEAEIPFKMAPLIFLSTIITHLFGGSAGREGAALQLGGSIGNQLGRWFRIDEKDKRVVVMCGMSAAFAAVFGTPMAAAIFSMEVVSVGVMYYAALVPCVFSALIASSFAVTMGISPETFSIHRFPPLELVPALEIILLAALCGGLSVLFCIFLHKTGDLYRKYLKNPYIRVMVAGILVIAITLLIGNRNYNGAGIGLIENAMEGKTSPVAFILKMVLTALTIEAGFKGGEIVPSFAVGASFGCLFGSLIGLSPSLCAAAGMISLFCGVTNCPITSILISFELFGYEAVPYLLMAVAVSYMTSGYYGLYEDQTIVYSKYKTTFINRHTKE